MKSRILRPSSVRAHRAAMPRPACAGGLALKLSSAQALPGPPSGTLREEAQRTASRCNVWRLAALWDSLRSLLSWAGADCRAGARPASVWRPPAAATPPDQRPRFPATFLAADQGARLAAERHLLFLLRPAGHRRGAYWETAGFLALWLSGLIGIAICLL